MTSDWQLIFGSSVRSSGRSNVPDVYRASFRRMMTRTGIAVGAATAASMHLMTFLVNALPRGVLGGLTALFWQIVTMVPLTMVYVLGGMLLGLLMNQVSMGIAVVLYRRAPMLAEVLCAALGLAIFAFSVGSLAMPSLLAEADPRYMTMSAVLALLTAAIGGGMLGLITVRRVRAYLTERGM